MNSNDNRPRQRKGLTERVSITLPHEVLADYREISKMTGRSVSALIRRRLEVRGGIVAVPETVMEELVSLYELLDRAMQLGGFDSETLDAFKAHAVFYERLVDLDTATTIVHGKKKRRKPKKRQEF